ncbi:Choline transporter-like protein 4 [Nymphon striatum]|nr:Choline transporter-like protein 4 [Nymphon striatum]
MILIALILAMVISFFWILLMRWIAGIMVWFSMIAMIALLSYGKYYFLLGIFLLLHFSKYVSLENVPGSDASYQFTTNLDSYLAMRKTWLGFGIVAAVVLGIVILLLIFLRNRIRIAISLLQQGSRFVKTTHKWIHPTQWTALCSGQFQDDRYATTELEILFGYQKNLKPDAVPTIKTFLPEQLPHLPDHFMEIAYETSMAMELEAHNEHVETSDLLSSTPYAENVVKSSEEENFHPQHSSTSKRNPGKIRRKMAFQKRERSRKNFIKAVVIIVSAINLLVVHHSRAIGSMMFSLFFPLIPYLAQLVFFVFYGSVAIYIASSGKAHYKVINASKGCCDDYVNGSICDAEEFTLKYNSTGAKCQFLEYAGDPNLFRAQIYNLFGLFWGLFFIVGVGQLTLAGAFASYYWAFDKNKDIPTFAISASFYRTMRYHCGSVAFGSLLLAIVRMIRVMLEYIDNKLKKYDNKVTKILM